MLFSMLQHVRYPGSSGGVVVYMVTAVVVVGWCVCACGLDSSDGDIV